MNFGKPIIYTIIAACGYVGLYYGLVVPTENWHHPLYITGERIPKYRIGGRVADVMFRPAHEIDRFMRPRLWSPISFDDK